MLSLVLLLLLFTRGLLLKLILTLLFFVGLFSFFFFLRLQHCKKKKKKTANRGFLSIWKSFFFFLFFFFFLVKLWRSSQLNSWCLSSCFLSAMPPVTICSDSALRFLSLRSSFGFLSAARLFQNSFFFFCVRALFFTSRIDFDRLYFLLFFFFPFHWRRAHKLHIHVFARVNVGQCCPFQLWLIRGSSGRRTTASLSS